MNIYCITNDNGKVYSDLSPAIVSSDGTVWTLEYDKIAYFESISTAYAVCHALRLAYKDENIKVQAISIRE